MYNKNGKKWLGKYNPQTGALITDVGKIGRVANFVSKGIYLVGKRFLGLLDILIYTGP